MVAHDGYDTIGGRKLGKLLHEAIKFVSTNGDKVACEDNEVTLLGIDEVDHLLHIFLVTTMESISMKVRELTDAIAIEGIRQLVELDGLFAYHEMATSVEVAYRDQNDGQKDETYDDNEHIF